MPGYPGKWGLFQLPNPTWAPGRSTLVPAGTTFSRAVPGEVLRAVLYFWLKHPELPWTQRHPTFN